MPTSEQLHILQAQIAPAAVACERSTRVPAEVSAGQCILESAWLTKITGAFNCWGIKAVAGQPGMLCLTHEVFTPAELQAFLSRDAGRTASLVEVLGDKSRYLIRDWFASYPSWAASFEAHAQLLTRGAYAQALQQYIMSGMNRNLKVYIEAIAKQHYATNPQYAQQLIDIATEPCVVEACAAARKATV